MEQTITIIGVLAACFVIINLLLFSVWHAFDSTPMIGIVGVLIGGLVGIISSFVTGYFGHLRGEKESEDRLKNYASAQALELTRLEFDLRRKTRQEQFYAPAKVYREFYNALFELYTTKEWPKKIEEMGLFNILKYSKR